MLITLHIDRKTNKFLKCHSNIIKVLTRNTSSKGSRRRDQ